MEKAEILNSIRQVVREKLHGDSTGHDYYHVARVARLCSQLAQSEGADPLVCTISGYMHDYCRPDEKERGISHTSPEALAVIRGKLELSGLDSERIALVMECIAEHEYYPHTGKHAPPRSLESRILQDADRLDAIGAIGIARTFMYAGAHGSTMYLPEEGKKNIGTGSAIAHFYEKLLLLASEMHTDAAKQTAQHYQSVMQTFLDEFYRQWECIIP